MLYAVTKLMAQMLGKTLYNAFSSWDLHYLLTHSVSIKVFSTILEFYYCA